MCDVLVLLARSAEEMTIFLFSDNVCHIWQLQAAVVHCVRCTMYTVYDPLYGFSACRCVYSMIERDLPLLMTGRQ